MGKERTGSEIPVVVGTGRIQKKICNRKSTKRGTKSKLYEKREVYPQLSGKSIPGWGVLPYIAYTIKIK